MTSITDIMTKDHRRCDAIFADAESSVSDSNWEGGVLQFQKFHQAMEHHFSMEEKVLFPAFELRIKQATGPTQVMRMEHSQMRQLLSEMAETVANRDRESYLGLAETLMIIMQQHNMKEEQMLYRMADQALGTEVPQVLRMMAEM
jgi:hemerythrin-like domain-containing protein